MKAEIDICFPCGYSYSLNYVGFPMFFKVSIDDSKLPICPIHGSNCKPMKK